MILDTKVLFFRIYYHGLGQGFWDNAMLGLMVEFVLRIKLKMHNILLKTNLPVFHPSIIFTP
jgi:hypothetical protein